MFFFSCTNGRVLHNIARNLHGYGAEYIILLLYFVFIAKEKERIISKYKHCTAHYNNIYYVHARIIFNTNIIMRLNLSVRSETNL